MEHFHMEHAGESSSAEKKKILSLLHDEKKWRSFDWGSDIVNVSGVDVTPDNEWFTVTKKLNHWITQFWSSD